MTRHRKHIHTHTCLSQIVLVFKFVISSCARHQLASSSYHALVIVVVLLYAYLFESAFNYEGTPKSFCFVYKFIYDSRPVPFCVCVVNQTITSRKLMGLYVNFGCLYDIALYINSNPSFFGLMYKNKLPKKVIIK